MRDNPHDPTLPPTDPESTPKTQPPAPPEAKLPPRRRNQVTRLVRALVARQEETQTLGFGVREFILAALPYRRLDALEYERRNGAFVFRVEASKRFGLPFGQDRLIPFWLATAFQLMGKPKDNTIRFRSASDILRAFDIAPGGKQRRELRGRLERIFGAVFYFQDQRKDTRWLEEGYKLIRRVDLWFEHTAEYTLWQNEITLSADFANDLRQSPIPIDLETVRGLKAAPAALDLYAWQAWRSYRLLLSHAKKPVTLPVFGESGLLAQLGTRLPLKTKEDEKKYGRRARQLLRAWQGEVKKYWPQCPNELSEDGSTFILRPARALHLNARLELPGVRKNPPPMRRTGKGTRLILVDDETPPKRLSHIMPPPKTDI